MALSIKTDEADALARAVAARTGESLTEAVTVALRERLARLEARPRVDLTFAMDRLRVEFGARERRDERCDDEVIGYDDHGAPA